MNLKHSPYLLPPSPNVRTKNDLKLLHVNGASLGDLKEGKANLFKKKD